MRGHQLARGAVQQQLAGTWDPSDSVRLPDWTRTFQAALAQNESCAGPVGQEDPAFDSSRPLPFQEVLLPFLLSARSALRRRSDSTLALLGPAAAIALDRQLLGHLSFVSSLALGQYFYLFRFDRAPASAIEAIWEIRPPSKQIYYAFVQHMRDGGLRQFFREYPVLARLLSNSVDQWIKNSADLCSRFILDLPDLERLLGWQTGRRPVTVEFLRTDLSDRHSGGQSVIEVGVSRSQTVIYKPRSVGPEQAYNAFLGRLNEQDVALPLHTLRTLDRGTYGWMEVVRAEPCHSKAEVRRFYARAGMTLAALYAMSVTDIHFENLIAYGEHPVIVDLETLLGSREPSALGPDASQDQVSPSFNVLSTGLLPRWQTAPDGHLFDLSGLGADEMQDPGIRGLAWESINTDTMRLVPDKGLSVSGSHRARLDDTLPSVRDHLATLVSGFNSAWTRLRLRRRAISADIPLRAQFEGIELRTLLRSTTTYTRLQLRLLHPEFLRDGIDRSLELEWLARPLTGTGRPSHDRRRVYEIERSAMENLDVPRFVSTMWPSGKGDSAEVALLRAPRDFDALLRGLDEMTGADRKRQVALITHAIDSRFPQEPSSNSTTTA